MALIKVKGQAVVPLFCNWDGDGDGDFMVTVFLECLSVFFSVACENYVFTRIV
jgi:hypothetical protein